MLSANDLKNLGESLEEGMRKRSEQKGEELANRIINSTANGRGLWVLILWPMFLTVMIAISIGVGSAFNLNQFVSIGIGLVVSVIWYKAVFTRNHPFWSSVFVLVGTSFFINLITDKI
jgi:hypothetical protein